VANFVGETAMRLIGLQLGLLCALALVGCKSGGAGSGNGSAEPSFGAPGKLTPGNYEIMRVDEGGEAGRFDVAVLSDDQAENFVGRYLGIVQGRLKPSYPGGSSTSEQYSCTTEEPTSSSSFIAEGHCTMPELGNTTDFKFTGKIMSEGFDIQVIRSGYGTSTPGKSDHIRIYGTLIK
jgi:hypothetical protein